MLQQGTDVFYNDDVIRNLDLFSESEKQYLRSLSDSCAGADFFHNQGVFSKYCFEFAFTTVKIEGSALSKQDVASVLNTGRCLNPAPLNDLIMVRNLKEAYQYIAGNDLIPNLSAANELHQILANGILQPADLGNMKSEPDYVQCDFTFNPLGPGSLLAAEMETLFANFAKLTDPFDRALYIHNNLIYLQYFADCNKRTARSMQLLSMKYDGVCPLVLIDNATVRMYLDYLDCLSAYLESGSYAKSKEFFIANYERVCKSVAKDLMLKDLYQQNPNLVLICFSRSPEINRILEKIGSKCGPKLSSCYAVRADKLKASGINLKGCEVFNGMRKFLKQQPMTDQEIAEMMDYNGNDKFDA